MLTNLIKGLLVIAGCGLAEYITASIMGGVSLPGLITFGFLIIIGAYEFARYVDKWAGVRESINDLTNVMDFETLKRLAPIADNPDMIQDFLQAYGTNYQAKVSELERNLAKSISAISETESELKRTISELQTRLSDSEANRKQTESESKRTISELTLQLSNWKAKYEVLESGTLEQKTNLLRDMYRSAQNTLNATKNGKS